jgi:hypothetical protein
VGTLLIEIGFFVLAVVLVLYFCKPIVIIAPICGLVVTIICIVLLPRVVRVCRIQWELTRLTQTLQNVVSEEMTRFMNEINREDLEKVLKKMSQDFQEAIGEEIAKVKNEFRCKYCVQLNNEELKRKLCDIYPNLLSKLKQLAADMVGESTTSGPTESDIQHVREEHNKFLNTLGSLLKGKLDEIVTSLSGNDEEKTQEVHLLTAVSS